MKVTEAQARRIEKRLSDAGLRDRVMNVWTDRGFVEFGIDGDLRIWELEKIVQITKEETRY